jgi:2-methylaconitate cis-trans-isomerase PrpF
MRKHGGGREDLARALDAEEQPDIARTKPSSYRVVRTLRMPDSGVSRLHTLGECVALFPARQRRVACSVYRGGTSKAVLFLEEHMPRDPSQRDRLILGAFGSPDARQIDGLGGADPLTSKVGFVGPASVPNADIDYTFGYVGITSSVIDYSGSCGNTAAAVGPFALDQGLIEAQGATTRVRIHNTNTGKIIACEFPTRNGEFVCEGDFKIDGVPGTGSKIYLDFAETVGSRTGKLLPTGNVRDELVIPSFGTILVSMVDVSNPFVFVRGEDLGIRGDETIEELSASRAVLERCELIRAWAAERMGLASAKDATAKSPGTPKIAVISRPVEASAVDVVARMTALQRLHKTFAGTGAVCLGVAAKIPGTLVNEVYGASQPAETPVVRIGHPSGTIQVEIDMSMHDGRFVLRRACLVRTARLIMDGHVRVAGDFGI